MKYVHGQPVRKSHKASLLVIWSLVAISGVMAWLTLTGQLFALSVNKTSPAVIVGEQYNNAVQATANPQQTISGEVLQPAGKLEIKTYNPQQTAPAKTLEQNVTIKVN